MKRLDQYFGISASGSSLATEILAGLATFMTMAYIIVVNPSILAQAGMDFGAVFVATVLAAALATAIMGIWAKWPVALAPGMGINAFFTYGVVLGMNQPWQVAMGAVFLSGVLFLILSLTGLRAWLINAIPRALKLGIGAGIGLFLAIIGLTNAGVVVDNAATLVGLGDLGSPEVLLAAAGFVAMVALDRLRVPGAIVIGILGISIAAWVLGVAKFGGVAGPVPSLAPTLFQLDIGGVISAGLISVVFAFLFVDFFDTVGTLTSVANLAGKMAPDGTISGVGRAVVADAVATTAGAVMGTSNTTSYIESGAGIKQGGRTGMTAVTVAVLFLLCLGFAPLAQSIPAFASAAALVFVATHFMRALKDIDWDDATEYAPAVLGAVTMPLTYSIADGIAMAFIVYACAKLLSGRITALHPGVLAMAAISVAHYVFS